MCVTFKLVQVAEFSLCRGEAHANFGAKGPVNAHIVRELDMGILK